MYLPISSQCSRGMGVADWDETTCSGRQRSGSRKRGRDRKRSRSRGQAREYLKVYETMPAQMLNAYHENNMARSTDKKLWLEMKKELKSGAKYMSELCDQRAERRGVGANRWLYAMVEFCRYQKRPEVKSENEKIMAPVMFKRLYDEIVKMLPHLEVCLAPKKAKKKEGAAALRGGVPSSSANSGGGAEAATKEKLLASSKEVWEWLSYDSKSKIRAFAIWQASGGLSHNAAVFHRGTQAFRYYGNHGIEGASGEDVTLTEFQNAVCSRHEAGNCGMYQGDDAKDIKKYAQDWDHE